MQPRSQSALNAERHRGVTLRRVAPKKAGPPNPEFGRRLSAAMDHAGLLQKDLVRELGVSAPTVSDYMSGKGTPRPHRLRRIAELVNETIDWLLGKDTMERGLSSKLLRLYETIGRERIDYLDELSADELREMVDRHELARSRSRRLAKRREPKPKPEK